MKKLLLIAVLTLASSVFADDQYLYWMMPDGITVEGTKAAYASIGIMDNASGQNTGYLGLYQDSATGPSYLGTDTYDLSGGVAALYAGGADGQGGIDGRFAGSSFYIELLNDSGTFLGRSEQLLSYSDVSKYLATLGGTGSGAAAGPWGTSTSFTTQAIPEPTSGLLLLLGVAGLALRRKNKKA